LKLTELISIGATTGSSSYSDSSSSELDSSSEELVSVGVGDLIELGTPSLKVVTRLTTCLGRVVLFSFFDRIFGSFDTRFLLTIGRAGISITSLACGSSGDNILQRDRKRKTYWNL